MSDSDALVSEFSVGRQVGASPSENKYYTLVLFDISDAKKYRVLVRVLKRYALRVQKSVFEAELKQSQLKELKTSIERIMQSERFRNDEDNVRIYTIAGHCQVTVYGTCPNNIIDENVFL